MPAQNIHVVTEPFKTLEEATDAFAVLQKQVRYLQEHIDVENIISKSLTAEVIKAGAITAEEMTVNELSAITANMGKLTSGEIYGAYIATSEGVFPLIEFSSTAKLLRASAAPNKSVSMEALNGTTSSPALVFRDGSNATVMDTDLASNEFFIASTGDIQLSSGLGRDIKLYGTRVRVSNWSSLFNEGANQNLQQALDSKASTAALNTKATSGVSTGLSGGHNHGIPDGTVLRTADGGTVTFFVAPQHSHSQT